MRWCIHWTYQTKDARNTTPVAIMAPMSAHVPFAHSGKPVTNMIGSRSAVPKKEI
jgi:hypothetical protein